MLKFFHQLFKRHPTPPIRSTIGFFGGRRVDIAAMASDPKVQQQLQDLLQLMAQIRRSQDHAGNQPDDNHLVRLQLSPPKHQSHHQLSP